MALPDQSNDYAEMRCPNTLHGIVKDGRIEVKCHHIRCTKGTWTVFHYYDPLTGALMDTKVLQDPAPRFTKGRKR